MPLFNRQHKLEQKEAQLRRNRDQILQDELEKKRKAEHRRKLDEYENRQKTQAIEEELARLKWKQDQERLKALEEEERRNWNNKVYLAKLAKQKQDEIEQLTQQYSYEVHCLKQAKNQDDLQAKARLEQLERELQKRDQARLAEEARNRKEQQKLDAEKRKIQQQQDEEMRKLMEYEKKRQEDELVHRNSSQALQELRDLIREKYELDMEIYTLRDVTPANRDEVRKRMAIADEKLQEIRSIVEVWNAKSFDEMEWEIAEQVKNRLLADGKRIWATNPPWPPDGPSGKPAPRPPPRPRPRGAAGAGSGSGASERPSPRPERRRG